MAPFQGTWAMPFQLLQPAFQAFADDGIVGGRDPMEQRSRVVTLGLVQLVDVQDERAVIVSPLRHILVARALLGIGKLGTGLLLAWKIHRV